MRFWMSFVAASTFLAAPSLGAELFYGFDDGTFDGWRYIRPDGTPLDLSNLENGWAPWSQPIDIGDGFDLLPATSGDFRIVPFPWETRDCLNGLECETQILRSPEFTLDGSGDITIDMIGGQLRGGTVDVAPLDFPAEVPDFPELRTSDPEVAASQGFALRDVASDEYLLFGFSDVENDGKMRDSDPPSRGQWQTVSISADELEPFVDDNITYTVDIYDSYLGGWGWIGFDSVRIPGKLAGEPSETVIDFDSDGDVDTTDIDALVQAIVGGENPADFDVTDDGLVNRSDLDAWLAEAATFNGYGEPYLVGDANLDGTAGVADLNAMALNWQQNKNTWQEGDFSADGQVNVADLNGLALNWQQSISAAERTAAESPAAGSAVPEPTSLALLLSALLGRFLCRNRHRVSVSDECRVG